MQMKKGIMGIMLLAGMLFSCGNTTTNDNDMKKENKAGSGTIETILARKSVRTYLDKPVESEKIETLLRAGMAAPSGMDRRPWELLVISDRSTLDSLAEGLPYGKMLARAPMAIVVCGDTTKSSYWYLDCSAVTQNILLAAESLELGAVWTAAYPYDDRMQVVKRHTGLPDHIHPLAVVPVGYPEGEYPPKDKYDEAKIHYDRW